jgi:hypothetical protein
VVTETASEWRVKHETGFDLKVVEIQEVEVVPMKEFLLESSLVFNNFRGGGG